MSDRDEIRKKKIALSNQYKWQAELSEGWFPSNPNILKDIRHKIRNKTYRTSKELLLDTRRDCSLFSYLLNVPELKKNESSLLSLTSLPVLKLENLIPGASGNISRFDLTRILEHQVQNLQILVISTAAVQILALHKGLDPDTAYLTSLFRVFGLSLAAWNHQHVYSRVLQSSGGYFELDAQIKKKLQYSPVSVFVNMARRWNLAPEIYIAALTENFFREEGAAPDLIEEIGRFNQDKVAELVEICKIAENLAIATVTSGSYGANELWDRGSKEVKKIIGEDGLDLIEESTNGLWSDYASLFSGWYNEVFSRTGKVENVASDYGKKYFHNNTHILQCPPEIQQAFAEIYKRMTDVNTATGAFHSLLTDLIPASGFLEGGVYIVDRASMTVSPLMMMGRAAKPGFKPAYLFNKSLDLDPLVKSLMSGTIVKGRVNVENREVLYISGAIGAPPDQIIIYLETSHAPFLSGEMDPTACFRAVQQCILDSVMTS